MKHIPLVAASAAAGVWAGTLLQPQLIDDVALWAPHGTAATAVLVTSTVVESLRRRAARRADDVAVVKPLPLTDREITQRLAAAIPQMRACLEQLDHADEAHRQAAWWSDLHKTAVSDHGAAHLIAHWEDVERPLRATLNCVSEHGNTATGGDQIVAPDIIVTVQAAYDAVRASQATAAAVREATQSSTATISGVTQAVELTAADHPAPITGHLSAVRAALSDWLARHERRETDSWLTADTPAPMHDFGPPPVNDEQRDPAPDA